MLIIFFQFLLIILYSLPLPKKNKEGDRIKIITIS